MASVTHAGRTIITDTQGGWMFAPGATGNAGQIVPFARSMALKVRVMATPGCVHRLTVDFAGTQGGLRAFVDDVRDLYDYTVGTLSVDGHGSYPACVFLGLPSFSEITALGNNRYLVTATMDVQQLI